MKDIVKECEGWCGIVCNREGLGGIVGDCCWGMILTYQAKLPLIAMFTVSTVCALMVLMVERLTHGIR